MDGLREMEKNTMLNNWWLVEKVVMFLVQLWTHGKNESLRFYKLYKRGHMDSWLFWKTLPEHDFVQKGRFANEERKQAKVYLIANTNVGKEKPVVIWKHENPICLKLLTRVFFLSLISGSPRHEWLVWIEFLKDKSSSISVCCFTAA